VVGLRLLTDLVTMYVIHPMYQIRELSVEQVSYWV